MPHTIEEIFAPSTGVEIVLNLNSLNPSAASSIIYDVNHLKQTIIVAQPLHQITPSTSFEEIHLTTLLKVDLDKRRFGIKCRLSLFIRDYFLSDNSRVGAITLEYTPPLLETNIRSAYRMPISRNFTVRAKLLFNNKQYYSTKDFFIRDISINGMGITIPSKVGKTVNSLTSLKLSSQAAIGMLLMLPNSKEPFAIIPLKIEITRIDLNYSKNQIFAGIKFIGLTPDKELQLNKFIHMAQLDELRRLSRLDIS